MPLFFPPQDTNTLKAKQFTLNLAQAAGTYDLAVCNSTGGVVIEDISIYCSVVGATFTSVSIQTNDTVPVIFLTSIEGAVANIAVGKNIVKAFTGATYLHTSKKIQYTIVGVTGTGTILVTVRYQPSVSGADIS